jgi:TPR repeat protein
MSYLTAIEGGAGVVLQGPAADALVAECLAAFVGGNIDALYDLAVAFSTGSHGAACDLVEAHKWFNIAAARGHEEAAWCRADVAEEMTAREIAEAQRRAREWLKADAAECRAA